MLSNELKHKLIEKKPNPTENIGKLIGRLHRYIQKWHEEKNPHRDEYRITPSLPALLSNVYVDGCTNKELAERAIVTKQGMSKLINETLKDGIIEIEKNKDDYRCNHIALTEKGADLLISIWENNQYLIEDFENHIGKEKTKLLMELLSELSESIGGCGKK